jgi:hypothetical protein
MYMKQCHYFSNPGFSKASYLCEDLLPGALVYREFVSHVLQPDSRSDCIYSLESLQFSLATTYFHSEMLDHGSIIFL